MINEDVTDLFRAIDMLSCGWSHTCAAVSEICSDHIVAEHPEKMPTITLFTMGDFDGFFGMLVQCIIQLMIMYQTLPIQCGMSVALITRQIIPSAAATTMLGNIFFGMQSIFLARKERRIDVTAQPHGINTVLIFAFMMLVMAPEYQLTNDSTKAWEVRSSNFYLQAGPDR